MLPFSNLDRVLEEINKRSPAANRHLKRGVNDASAASPLMMHRLHFALRQRVGGKSVGGSGKAGDGFNFSDSVTLLF